MLPALASRVRSLVAGPSHTRHTMDARATYVLSCSPPSSAYAARAYHTIACGLLCSGLATPFISSDNPSIRRKVAHLWPVDGNTYRTACMANLGAVYGAGAQSALGTLATLCSDIHGIPHGPQLRAAYISASFERDPLSENGYLPHPGQKGLLRGVRPSLSWVLDRMAMHCVGDNVDVSAFDMSNTSALCCIPVVVSASRLRTIAEVIQDLSQNVVLVGIQWTHSPSALAASFALALLTALYLRPDLVPSEKGRRSRKKHVDSTSDGGADSFAGSICSDRFELFAFLAQQVATFEHFLMNGPPSAYLRRPYVPPSHFGLVSNYIDTISVCPSLTDALEAIDGLASRLGDELSAAHLSAGGRDVCIDSTNDPIACVSVTSAMAHVVFATSTIHDPSLPSGTGGGSDAGQRDNRSNPESVEEGWLDVLRRALSDAGDIEATGMMIGTLLGAYQAGRGQHQVSDGNNPFNITEEDLAHITCAPHILPWLAKACTTLATSPLVPNTTHGTSTMLSSDKENRRLQWTEWTELEGVIMDKLLLVEERHQHPLFGFTKFPSDLEADESRYHQMWIEHRNHTIPSHLSLPPRRITTAFNRLQAGHEIEASIRNLCCKYATTAKGSKTHPRHDPGTQIYAFIRDHYDRFYRDLLDGQSSNMRYFQPAEIAQLIRITLDDVVTTYS